MRLEEKCAFCGCQENIKRPIGLLAAIIEEAGSGVCQTCFDSLEGRMPVEWFRYLKKKDTTLWKKIVAHNCLESSRIADQIRRVRIEK